MTLRTSGSLILVPALGILFLLFGCCVQLESVFLVHLIIYIVMYDCCCLEVCVFLMGDRKGVGMERRGGGEDQAGI